VKNERYVRSVDFGSKGPICHYHNAESRRRITLFSLSFRALNKKVGNAEIAEILICSALQSVEFLSPQKKEFFGARVGDLVVYHFFKEIRG